MNQGIDYIRAIDAAYDLFGPHILDAALGIQSANAVARTTERRRTDVLLEIGRCRQYIDDRLRDYLDGERDSHFA